MIKRAGDWTHKLINKLYECKKRSMRFYELGMDGSSKELDAFGLRNYNEYEIFNLLHDIHQEIPLRYSRDRNRMFYPKVNISKPCPTPCETFMDRKNLILIGAGSGIAPFLPFLEEVIRHEKGKEDSLLNNTKYLQSCLLVFVAREGEQVSWVSNYLFHLLSSE